MDVHLLDGTYELFRAWFGAPQVQHAGREVGATRALLGMWSRLLRTGTITHAGVAFDHVIESFRNGLFDGYKTGAGLPVELTSQFELAERAARALGLVAWPMVEFEADDAIATMAARLESDARVGRVLLGSPDKDLAQCVRGERVVLWHRFDERVLDHDAVVAKFGVTPASIADLLALTGDEADGVPGVPKWGQKSASALLTRYVRLEDIPDDDALWDVKVRGAKSLADSLRAHRADAVLYKRLTTLRTDAPLTESLDELAWRGVDREALGALAEEIGDKRALERAP